MILRLLGNSGKNIIYLSLIITITLWILAKSSLEEMTDFPLVAINQVTALLGTVLFAWSMVLSTRLGFIEELFGGLDKIYHVHRRTSEWGFALILMHPLALAIDRSSHFTRYFLPLHNDQAMNIGIISFWIFVYLIVTTLFIREIKLKYHIWKYTHKFINLAMILAMIHILLIRSDTSNFFPLAIWIYGVTIIGVMAGIYKLLFYKMIAPHYQYVIKSIKKRKDTYDIILKPVGKAMAYVPGQYAYVSFKSEKISDELHPYCLASQEQDNSLRLVIKELGDFTRTLGKLKKGETAVLYGPHGRIGKKYYEDDAYDAVFIGGGIGIAPFLAMFRSGRGREHQLDGMQRETTLYYCTCYKEDAIFDEELATIADGDSGMHYHNQCSREGAGHLSIPSVVERLRNLRCTKFYLCATGKMMEEIKFELLSLGVRQENIVSEDFDMI